MRKLRRQSRIEEVSVPLEIMAKNKEIESNESIGPEVMESKDNKYLLCESLLATNSSKKNNFRQQYNHDNEAFTEQKKHLKSIQDLPRQNYRELTGNDLKLLLCIHSHTKIENDFQTEFLSKDYLAIATKIKVGSIRTTVARLSKNSFISKIESKKGPGSYRRFTIDKNIYVEVNKDFFRRASKERTKGVQEPLLKNNINIKTSTTSIDDEWANVQIPHSLRAFNFGPHIIKQVRDRNLLKAIELQDSLDAFAFDLSENDLINSKKISDPVRYFMGITNKKTQYAQPGNFISDELKALDENKKRLESLKKHREEMERVTTELASEEWMAALDHEDKVKLVPHSNFIQVGSHFHNEMLKSHFNEAIKKGISPNLPLT